MNKEEIEKVEKAIKYANEYCDYLNNKHEKLYKECGYEYSNVIPSDHDTKRKIKQLEYLKEVLLKLNEENIDLNEKYFITDNIYLHIFLWNNSITFMFYLEDDKWLYENYIDSHSGLNEWINDYINELYELYSGNSRYCHAFGTCSLKDYKRIIENENKDKYSSEKRYSVEQVVKNVKNLIEYFTDEKNETRNAIIEDINARFDKLHTLLESKGE